MAASARAFVRRHTRLQPVAGLSDIRLHLADEVVPLWRATVLETGDPDAPLPYWGVAWGGGLAIAHYLREHPEAVAGRHILDLASGSGLCAIAAMRAGAASVTATEVDPYAIAAIRLNARADHVRVGIMGRDVLDDGPPGADVILVGDVCYDAALAERVLTWLRRADDAGLDILLGDPGRRHLPTDALVEIAAYPVRTTSELEDLALLEARVYHLS